MNKVNRFRLLPPQAITSRLKPHDIDNAANKVERHKLIFSKLPGKIETDAA